jgi:CubicO group peptidase (beta-lactamase class C family)
MQSGYTRPDLIPLFAAAFGVAQREHGEQGLQIAIYQHGELVVDAWAGLADVTDQRPVTADTLFPVFSMTKAVTALALHLQAERGLIEYDAPIALYWPEFAANGKGAATVQQALDHRLGVWQMPEGVTPETMCDFDRMVHDIAALPPMSEPGTQNCYMSLTFGWIVAEIVRRTDPQGRSFRQFVLDEITDRLGIEDLWIGVPPSEHHRVARLIDAPPRDIPLDAPTRRALPAQLGAREEVYGRHDVREACIPGANGLANARSMARFFALLAGGGALNGVRLLSEERVASFRIPRPDADKPDAIYGYPVRVGSGFWTGGNDETINYGKLIGQSRNAIGHPGSGGSVGWADPDAGIAVAICHNRMLYPPFEALYPIRAAVAQAFGAP